VTVDEQGYEPALGTVAPSDPAEAEALEASHEPEAPHELETSHEPAASNDHGDAELSPSGTQARVSWPGIAFRVDPDDPAPPVAVNCDERMHICHAVCCKLNFALTPEEVDAGTVKWDLGFPYMIRHGANGYCSHNDTATGRCTNYANRPGVCHRYSCAHDPRIWKDFDAMILNEDWIRANLTHQSRITVGKALPLMEVKHGTPAKGHPNA
jgi:Fe-S-cluster containining protein